MTSKAIPQTDLEHLQKQLSQLKHGQKEERKAIFNSYRIYGSQRTLSRLLQKNYGRQRKVRVDSGESSELLLKSSKLVAEKKLEAQRLTTRWISTERAIQLLQKDGKLPWGAKISPNSVNRLIKSKGLLEIKRSHEVMGAPYPFFKHFFDCSGSTTFKTVSFDPPVVETVFANHSQAEKNHPEQGRRKLYLFALVDAFSGFLMMEYRTTPAPTSYQMAEFLLKNWKTWGKPDFITSDNGSENFGTVENLLKTLEIGRIKSKPGNPRGRGAVERVFRTVFQDFEAPFLMEEGLGKQFPLEELNQRLQRWLEESYNSKRSRMGGTKTSRFEIYVGSGQVSETRQVNSNVTTPMVLIRKVLRIGRGSISFKGELYEFEESNSDHLEEVEVFVLNQTPQFVITENSEKVILRKYSGNHGTEFLDFNPTSEIKSKWEIALVSLGLTERQLINQIGEELTKNYILKSEKITLEDLLKEFRGILP